jgi:hypothetical protein
MARLNPTTVFLVSVALVLAGLLLPGALGAVAVLVLAAASAALLAVTWRQLDPQARALRLAVLALLAAFGVAKLM